MAAAEDPTGTGPVQSRWRSVFPPPERRTRTDLMIAAAIVAGLLVAAAAIWLGSDARGTESVVADRVLPIPAPVSEVPSTVREAWRTRDIANSHPVVAAGAVVTADGATVTGRDPATGTQLWRYARNRELCGVEGAFTTAIAVYRDGRGCGQVTQLSGSTGRRLNARTSPASDAITLSTNFTPASDAGYGFVMSLGTDRLELWRSDMVRTLEYGYVDAPVNSGAQPRTGCQFSSAAFNLTRIAVLERCPGETGDRLSVLKTDPKDSQKPEEFASTVVPDLIPNISGGKVISVSGERVALYLPPHHALPARIGIYDSKLSSVAEYPLPKPLSDSARMFRAGEAQYLWTGSSLIRFNGSELDMSWTIPDVIGIPAEMAGQLLVPVPGAILAADPDTGTESKRIPVQRNGYSGPVMLSVLGSTILEKRGDQLAALHG